MYKDIIHYQLNENSSEAQLLAVASKVYEDWMKNQKGFIKWEISQEKDDMYIDIVSWESRECAKASEAKMADMPHASEWFACYQPRSISSKSIQDVAVFGS